MTKKQRPHKSHTETTLTFTKSLQLIFATQGHPHTFPKSAHHGVVQSGSAEATKAYTANNGVWGKIKKGVEKGEREGGVNRAMLSSRFFSRRQVHLL